MAYNPADKNKKQNTGTGPERNIEGKERQGNMQGQRGQGNVGQRPGGQQGNLGEREGTQFGGNPQKGKRPQTEEEDE